jgi:hypothetical protein
MFAALDQHCELRAAVERLGDDKFALYYEIRNKGRQTIFVFDGVEPQEAPYYVERAGNLLAISQKIIAPPPGLELERPEVPLAARVDPGQRLRHKLELSLPLRTASPYPHLSPRRERSREYLLIDAHFEVGYFPAPDASLAREAGEGFVLPGLDPGAQAVIRVGPVGRVAFDPSRQGW